MYLEFEPMLSTAWIRVDKSVSVPRVGAETAEAPRGGRFLSNFVLSGSSTSSAASISRLNQG